MTAAKFRELFRAALNSTFPETDRIVAIEQIGRLGTAEAIEEILPLAESDSESTSIQAAAGRSLAALYVRHGRLFDAPLPDFTGPAYIAFDEEVARMTAQ